MLYLLVKTLRARSARAAGFLVLQNGASIIDVETIQPS
jgi:hypothetical protein